MGKSCYCCDRPAVGQGDHVPPISLFASGTFAFAPPIIVPSCTTHNQAKSAADEYLKFVFSSSAEVVPAGVRDKTVRSVMRHARNPKASLQRFGMERASGGLSIGVTAPVNEDLLEQALEKVARGIYYHHHDGSRKLTGDVDVYPIFLGIVDHSPLEVRTTFDNISELVNRDLISFPVHGEHQEVFAYQIFDSPEVIMVHLVFYQTKVATVMRRLLV